MNLWQRVLQFFSRKAAQVRSFAGAQVTRLTFSMATSSASINADLDSALVPLRARARSLSQNNEFAARFITLVGVNIVGATGPTLQVRAELSNAPGKLDKAANDAIEIHWQRWGRTADAAGKCSLPHLLRIIVEATARDGESLVVLVRDRTSPYGLKLQVLEADRLDETKNGVMSDGTTLRQGVEIDSFGRPIAYHIKESHPGELFQVSRSTTKRVPASAVCHVFLARRAEQVRGYTWLHAALMRLAQLQGFEESAVIAARIGASKIATIEQAEDAAPGLMGAQAVAQEGDPTIQQPNLHFSAEPGEVFQLPPGYKLNSWDPQYPHENFEAFVQQCLRAVSMGFGVATHNLSGNMSDVNYSSARIAELTEREIWTMLQEWFISNLLLPVYEAWLESALLLQQITFPSGKALPADRLDKFLNASRFQGRRWAWVDPAKEAEASKMLIELGLASRTQIAASQGRDFADIVLELQAEREALQAAGLAVVGTPAPTPAPAAPPEMKTIFEAGAIQMHHQAGDTQVHAPISVPPTPIEVKNEHTINVPEREVHLDARIEGTTINNITPHPVRKTTEIERDAHHEAVRTVETFEMSAPNNG